MPTTTQPLYWTDFIADVSHLTLPDKFTYPFYYQAHPLAVIASEELQQKLTDFHPHTFDVATDNDSAIISVTDTENKVEQQGRMYGVLIVKDVDGKLGYLSALSGNASESVNNTSINFVPTIYQAYSESEYEQNMQVVINDINAQITELSSAEELKQLTQSLTIEEASFAQALQHQQALMRENKKARKEKRAWLDLQLGSQKNDSALSEAEYKEISIGLSRASVTDKKALQALKLQHQDCINAITAKLTVLTDEIAFLKKRRKQLSAKLQKHFFKQYQMLNIKGERKDLVELFAETIVKKPPSGSGDCAAPKLLQYAFEHNLTPVCMAEFWWGAQPKSEIRKHKHFYPACQSKCLPILTHMLNGMTVDENPLLTNPAENIDLEIVFQDDDIVVVNKPAGLLSVPGKSIKDSVYTRIQEKFPHATGGLIVHRLDMATSGLLMLALNERAHKHLQQQFINKEVNKRYVATIGTALTKRATENIIETTKSGDICLPLRVNLDDRPKQMVCYEHGKYAKTHWQVISKTVNTTKLFLYPITGRTHQLRMHCAHPDGLNSPIIGDTLYGTPANRLHLHAQRLSFTHPITKEKLTFEVDEDF
ncbi:RluA family pseudouridine synthase [Colwellia sp. E2M01]|uniref:RluA family pseudouridine synthase n=1 Tax=Colwellia sp. E2M01 TaxID=2841561 RepID=UPI001C094870|nr:RluA family pseudouridine synthase [Colwellia sp. E2M01]MBU2870647.1 RluA family pseudouridine synthase [Colwellia sp. E2M01]